MAEAVLEARRLRKEFFRRGRDSARYFNAVEDVDLALRRGELVVLMGRSGSGKSTLLNMLAGLLEPTEGSVACGGVDVYALDDASRSQLRNELIGVVPQGQSALHSLTVVQNVMLPARLYGKPDEAAALALLEQVGIAHLADSFPSQLSGGESRRMAIARALVMGPSVLFADEPTADLDDENTEAVLSLFRGQADCGMSVFVVSHEQAAAAHADEVLRMDAGRISASQPREAIC